MNILDFGSGEMSDTLDFWTEGGAVESLQKIIGQRVSDITLHAFDPLEITTPSIVSRAGIEFHFHDSYGTLPENIDIVCALNPNPIVKSDAPGASRDNWEFHHRRYTPFLIDILREKLVLHGVCVLQFDTEWRALYGPTGTIHYIESLIRYTSRGSALLQTISLHQKDARFWNHCYSFEEVSLCQKVPKNLQNSDGIL